MKPIENFKYNDIVLYAKGWYERTDDIFEDIKKCIAEDGVYSVWDKMPHCDIVHHVLNCLDCIHSHLDDDERKNHFWLCSHTDFMREVKHTMEFYDLDIDRATIYTVLSVLGSMEIKHIKLKKPIYGKGRRRLGLLFNSEEGKEKMRTMTYKEMNKRAAEVFNSDETTEKEPVAPQKNNLEQIILYTPEAGELIDNAAEKAYELAKEGKKVAMAFNGIILRTNYDNHTPQEMVAEYYKAINGRRTL